MAGDDLKQKAPDAKTDQQPSEAAPQGEWPNEGEGNKSADEQYRDATRKFVRSGAVAEQAEKAADSLDGPERAELEDAERRGREKARR